MNDNFKELKERLRRLDEVLVARGMGNSDFAQAVSQARRATRDGDRKRDPTPKLRALLEKAEALGRGI